MKKILLSLGTVVFVGAMVASATGAFFSDTETSTGNTFAAGDIDLKIDNESYVTNAAGQLVASPNNSWSISDLTNQLFFSFSDVKPGDIGEDTISVHAGTNDAWACMAADMTETPDNGINEPEEDADDVTDGVMGGELQNFLNFTFWNDDGDNVYETGETQITQLTGPASSIFNGTWLPIADSSLGASSTILGNSTKYVGKAWCFGGLTLAPVAQDGLGKTGTNGPLQRGTGVSCNGSGENNIAQTDGIKVDVSFYAVQTRNNSQFLCSSLPKFEGQEPIVIEVGADLASYVAPTEQTCSVIVTGSQSIQTAVNAAADNSTVCVAPSYDMTGDNSAIRIEKLGLTLAATVRGVDLDVPVVLSNSNVTVTGFDGVIGQAESPAEQAAFYLDNDADGAKITFNTVTGGAGAAILTETGAALAGGLIANNVLNGATQGIYTNPHTGMLTIEYNDIDNNVAGIAGLMGALVRYNEFEHAGVAQEAIGVDSTFDSNAATVTFNNFLNGTRLNDYGAVAMINAENNFWNTGGVNQTTGGQVDFTPEAGAQYAHN